MLELIEWLTPEAAMRWMRERQEFAEPPGELDVDPFVIASGYGDSGAGLYRPSRGSAGANLVFDEERGGVIVDGDLICEGFIENRGVVFVRGNLVCRSLLNSSGYLVVAGDLCAQRLFGENEPGGTIIMGSCDATQAVTLHVHQLSVWGERRMDWIDDEGQGTKAAQQRLIDWGLLLPGEEPYPWPLMHQRLAAWTATAPALDESWTARTFTPRSTPFPKGRNRPPSSK